jgi:hypothetical protein
MSKFSPLGALLIGNGFVNLDRPFGTAGYQRPQDQSAADRAEYEWKQRRIREAVAAYLKRQARERGIA